MRTVLTIVAIATMPTADAHASPDLIAGFAKMGATREAYTGPLGREFHNRAVKLDLAAGLRVADLSLSMGLSMGEVGSQDATRHSERLSVFEFGPDLHYSLRRAKVAQPYLRVGARRLSLSGDTEVRRLCAESSTCSAGFFDEVPSYQGYALRVGIGVQFTLLHDNVYGGLFVDAGYDYRWFEIIETPVDGGVFTVSVGLTLGAGRASKQTPTEF